MPKYIIIILILLGSSFPLASRAAVSAVYKDCVQRGYKVINATTTTAEDSCQMPDKSQCLISDFNSGACGAQYKAADYCVKQGNMVWDLDKCCAGLKPYLPLGLVGQATCQPVAQPTVDNRNTSFGYLLGLIEDLKSQLNAFLLGKQVTPVTACTQEAKQCPDGSFVGRTGAKCEFAACPGTASTSTTDWKVYHNDQAGYQLKYPTDFSLEHNPYIFGLGGEDLSVKFPDSYYQGVNVYSAYITARASTSATEATCLADYKQQPAGNSRVKPSTVTANGQTFYRIEESDAGAGHFYEQVKYVSFKSPICYQLILNMDGFNDVTGYNHDCGNADYLKKYPQAWNGCPNGTAVKNRDLAPFTDILTGVLSTFQLTGSSTAK